jgi:hypothetical protein
MKYGARRNTAPGYADCNELRNAYGREESDFDAFRIRLELFVRRGSNEAFDSQLWQVLLLHSM